MPSHALPRWWRGAVATAAALQLFPFLYEVLPDHLLHQMGMIVTSLAGAVVGVGLAGGMIRRRGADALAALVGIGAAILLAFLASTPLHLLIGLGVGVPCALTVARRDWMAAPLAVGGFALQAIGLYVLVGYRGPASTLPGWPGFVLAAGSFATAVGLIAFAVRARPERPEPLAPRQRVSIVAGGAILLVLSFALGGHLFFLPLWPLAFALILVPPLARWRAWPLGAALIVGLALGGLLPVATCVADPWSDAIVPGVPPEADAYLERATLYEMAGSGPGWSSGGGFSGVRVRCPDLALAVAGVWAMGLVGASMAVVTRPTRP